MKRLLAFVMLILGGLAAFFRSRSKRFQAEAARERDRADQADAVNDAAHRRERDRERLGQKHRQEKQDAQEQLDAGDRDHLDNDW